ncbi:hypothetical protein MPNTM1_05499 [Mycolicibacterium parafortuitum]|uniref:hypothetical protein n=1 Tax=Mycolicibacterium parafortuitum TaxID=39692 RepID=UPI0032C422BC
MIAAAGVKVKNARDSLIGVLMVRTAQALKLATLPHTPRMRYCSELLGPVANTNAATRNATPTVTSVGISMCCGFGHVVATA